MWLLQPICQVAYFVADAVAAARRHSRTFGSGPFFVFEHVPYKLNIHRGVEREFDHTTVIGQWGGVMVEFMQQHNPHALHAICTQLGDVPRLLS